jgi:hypothetical protein
MRTTKNFAQAAELLLQAYKAGGWLYERGFASFLARCKKEYFLMSMAIYRKYRTRLPEAIEPKDIEQQMLLETHRAIGKFDPTRGTTIAEYLVFNVHAETKKRINVWTKNTCELPISGRTHVEHKNEWMAKAEIAEEPQEYPPLEDFAEKVSGLSAFERALFDGVCDAVNNGAETSIHGISAHLYWGEQHSLLGTCLSPEQARSKVRTVFEKIAS